MLLYMSFGRFDEAALIIGTLPFALKAAPAITDAVKVGDKVDFDLTLTGSAGEVTAIRKQ